MRSASHTQSRAKTSRQVKSSAARKRQKYPQSSGLFSGEVDADQPVEGGIRSAAGDKANKKMSIFAAKQRKPLEMRLKFYEKAYRKCANHVKSLQAQLAEDKENGPDCNCPESGDCSRFEDDASHWRAAVANKEARIDQLVKENKDLKEKLKKPEVKEMEVQAGWGPGEGREMMARPTERQKEAEQQAEQAKAAKQPRAQQPQQVQAQVHQQKHAKTQQNQVISAPVNQQQANINTLPQQSQAQNPEINQQIINQQMANQQQTEAIQQTVQNQGTTIEIGTETQPTNENQEWTADQQASNSSEK
ncbi:hypothetical protein HYD_2090 [Candidatus Hydrogenosomobacter endosymbioticus]|uniref:Uncharacterized protein n=2 Tax=Candidatus Hydrogenosomobacter endosymbioticus TaxID=2558174 RepID=A0ABM7V9E4_9PROT|nr:hypothetical protein HYD_2090 [Candidatus Hydrogenosomobacter endosymbioticus]